MHKHPDCLIDHLVVITSLLLKVLDPHFPSIRDICLPASTKILRSMVEIFPMVSFHQEKQKLAVGNSEGLVVIYDMRTASKWQLFTAHQAPVSAISFSPNGEQLVTYSPREGTCKVWNTDGSSMLTLLGMSNRAIKSFDVVGVRNMSAMKPMDVLKSVRFEWDSVRMFSLKPGKNLNKQSFSI
jgi:WD40 repeat protein